MQKCQSSVWDSSFTRIQYSETPHPFLITPCAKLSGQTWSRTFNCWYWLFYHVENLKTSWGLEREFQGAFSEPIWSFLTFFDWEISKEKVKDRDSFFAVTSFFSDYCEIEHLCLYEYNFQTNQARKSLLVRFWNSLNLPQNLSNRDFLA